MLSAISTDRMLPFECEDLFHHLSYCDDSDFPGFLDVDYFCSELSCDAGSSAYDESSTPINIIGNNFDYLTTSLGTSDDSFNEDIYRVVDPSLLTAEGSSKTAPYSPFSDHSYTKVCPDESYDQPIKEENDIDVWNRDDEDEDEAVLPVPLPPTRTRKPKRSTRSVSIKRAATVALKKTRGAWMKTNPPKRIKIENSLETTPSSSDYEDSVKSVKATKSKSRGAKYTAIRAISSINSNTKAVKSEVKRTNHNMSEKIRREEMSRMMSDVRRLVPKEFFGNERAREKSSKQKVLDACRLYILSLRQTQCLKKEEMRRLQKEFHGNSSKLKELSSAIQRNNESKRFKASLQH